MRKRSLFRLALLLVGVLFVQDSRAEDYTRFSLPDGALARLGKGYIGGGDSYSSSDRAVAYSPDGTRIAVAGSIAIWLYDAATGAEVALLTGHADRVNSVSYSPDGQTLASASWDETVRLWDVETGQEKARPNPFNPDTYIPFQLHEPAPVRLSIYDVRGALVREIDVGHLTAGQYLTSPGAIRWDGLDQRGQRAASGVYLYRLQGGAFAQVRKMLLVK